MVLPGLILVHSNSKYLTNNTQSNFYVSKDVPITTSMVSIQYIHHSMKLNDSPLME